MKNITKVHGQPASSGELGIRKGIGQLVPISEDLNPSSVLPMQNLGKGAAATTHKNGVKT